jgi:hypothetical protein
LDGRIRRGEGGYSPDQFNIKCANKLIEMHHFHHEYKHGLNYNIIILFYVDFCGFLMSILRSFK